MASVSAVQDASPKATPGQKKGKRFSKHVNGTRAVKSDLQNGIDGAKSLDQNLGRAVEVDGIAGGAQKSAEANVKGAEVSKTGDEKAATASQKRKKLRKNKKEAKKADTASAEKSSEEKSS